MIAALVQAAAEYGGTGGGKFAIDPSGMQQIEAFVTEHRMLLLGALLVLVILAFSGSTRRI